MRLFAIALVSVVICGCGPSAEVVAYKKAVRNYLEEGKATVKLWEDSPTAQVVDEKLKLMEDLYVKLPEKPRGTRKLGYNENIRKLFSSAQTMHQMGATAQFTEALKDISNTIATAETDLEKPDE